MPPFTPEETEDHQLLACAATELYRMRRRRDRHMPTGLVGEPAWDILLALYMDQDREVSVSSACLAANVPQTTGLRWLDHLVNEGYVGRWPLDGDRRKVIVSLTIAGRSLMEQCLRSMLRE